MPRANSHAGTRRAMHRLMQGQASAWSTAAITWSGVSSSRQTLRLRMLRSQPSKVQGMHGRGFCTIHTLPWFCMVPLASHDVARPPIGHGPQTRGSMGPNKATVGHPAAAARCVVDVSGPMIDSGARKQLHRLRPLQLTKFADTIPNIFKIAALGFARTADRDDRETALRKTRRDCAPSIWCPFLVGEHRCRVDDGVLAGSCNGRGLRCCGANQFRNALNVEGIREPEILLDAVKFLRRGDGPMQCNALERACKPRITVRRYADAPSAGRKSEGSRPSLRSAWIPRCRKSATGAESVADFPLLSAAVAL